MKANAFDIVWHTQEAVIFKFTNVVCENHNKTWITVHWCRLRAISRNKTTFNLNVTLNYPVDHPVNIRGQLLQKANGYKPWLFSANIDACRFMKRAYNPLAILVFKLFKEFSNFNHSCPYVVSIQLCSLRPLLIHVFCLIGSGDYTWFLPSCGQNTECHAHRGLPIGVGLFLQ